MPSKNKITNKITNNITNKITNKIIKSLKSLKKYKKEKKNKNLRDKKTLRKNVKKSRLAKGREHEMPFLISSMLDKTSKSNYNKEFYNKDLMIDIMSNIPIQDVKKAIRRSDLMKSYTHHIEEKKVKVEKLKEEIKRNDELLIKKKEELKKLISQGLDGPSRRTRSQGRYNQDSKIQKLEKEITDLTRSIDSMKYRLKNLINHPAYLS